MRVQHGLVVLVDQHHHALPGPTVQGFKQVREPLGADPVGGRNAALPLDRVELRHQAGRDVARLVEVPAAEAEPQHRVAHGPVPAVVDRQTGEQGLVAFEQLLQRVQEQALAEAPRARQEVVRSLIEQPAQVRGLVDVVAALLADRPEGLDADGQSASGHVSLGDPARSTST